MARKVYKRGLNGRLYYLFREEKMEEKKMMTSRLPRAIRAGVIIIIISPGLAL
jgi:hypothetical protein